MNYQHDLTQYFKERKWNPGQVNTDLPPPNVYDHEMAPRLPSKAMYRYLTDRGLSDHIAMFNGWYPINRKGLRIYIPATSRIEGHVYWQARAIEGQELRYDSPNGPRRDALVVVRGKVQPQSTVCVVEGPMDALAMAELTGVTGVALMGLSPSLEAKEHLALICQEYEQVICLPDKAETAGMLIIQNFLANKGIMSTCKIPLAQKDVACYSLRERRELIS